MHSKSRPISFETLSDWSAGHFQAHGNPTALFWQMDHMHLRAMPRHAANEAIMVERMWDCMGPEEHAWFSRFFPDVRERYPLETAHVNPWNARMAAQHYGLTPSLSGYIFNNAALKRENVPLQDVLSSWLALREQHAMPTNCWQLTAEILQSYHCRDELPISQRVTYQYADERIMRLLQTLCPSQEWPLALACVGIASSSIKNAFDHNVMGPQEHQAMAWLHWWMEKSPDCLRFLALTWVRKTEGFEPTVEPTTALLLELSQGAIDPRDTFQLARQGYGDMKPSIDATIDCAALAHALDTNG